jgi:arylsulfatase
MRWYRIRASLISGLDWFPTFVAAAGDLNVVEELKRGKQVGDRNYKVHLDGYNQMDLITGKGPSKRNEVFYFAEGTLGAVRIGDYKYRFIDQPNGWFGGMVKPDWPILVNLRLDPFERTGLNQSIFAKDWWGNEFWRFVFVRRRWGDDALSGAGCGCPGLLPAGADLVAVVLADR